MRKFAKTLTILTALVVIASLLAMSGMSSIVTAQDATATATPTITPTFAPSVEGTLTLWVNLDRVAIVEAAGKAFTAKYNVPVVIQTMGFGDVRSNFTIAAPAGEGADIILGAHDWIGALYGNGLLAEIDLGDKAKSFDPAALKLFTYDGKLVGMPYQVEAIAMYYNKDLVPEPPKTWAEAIALAEQLQKDGKVDQGIAIPTDAYHHYPILSGFGGGVFGKDANGNYDPKQVLIDSEGTIKGATEIDRLVKAGIFRAAVDYGAGSDLFKKGRLAMWVTGPWELNNLRNTKIDDKPLNFGVAKIPMMEGVARPFIGGQGFMINKFSKNLLLAQAFLTEFVATDEIMNAMFKAQAAVMAWLPSREANKDADLDVFAASIADGDPMPTIPQMAAFWNTAGNAITLIYQQKEAPDKVMKEAAAAARAEIEKSGN